MRHNLAAHNGRDPAPRPGDGDTAPSSGLLCRAGSALAALPVEQVIEIMRALPLEPIAGAPAAVLGLSVIRGAPTPVVDVGRMVGGAATQATRLVTVDVAGRSVALAMTDVIGISAIAAAAFAQLPPLLQNAAEDAVAAVGTLDSELLVFLRASRLVPDDVFALLDAERAAS